MLPTLLKWNAKLFRATDYEIVSIWAVKEDLPSLYPQLKSKVERKKKFLVTI
jgi:hypothetical protein